MKPIFFELPYLYNENYKDLSDPAQRRGLLNFCCNLIAKGYFRLYLHKSEIIEDDFVSNKDMEKLLVKSEGISDYAGLFVVAFNYLAEKHNQEFWVEKTPGHTHHATSILNQIPSAKAITLVRDPRDILCSKKKREEKVQVLKNDKSSAEANMQGFVEYDPFWTTLAWRHAARSIITANIEHTNRMLVIRYEDFARNPVENAKKICRFLDLDFREQMLDLDRYNVSEWSKQERSKSAGVVTDSINKWITSLNRGESGIATRLAYHELKYFGYKIPKMGIIDHLASFWYVIMALPQLIRRLYKKLKHKGARYTISVVKNYINRLKK